MLALSLGLLAALAWGVHDICVRYVSQKTNIYIALLTVLTVGTFLQIVYLVVLQDNSSFDYSAMPETFGSGIAFIIASIGLYKAFEIGPVKLVAPIIASYPIFTIASASLGGQTIPLIQWLAVLVIISGVSIVASHTGNQLENNSIGQRRLTLKLQAVLWALASALGFAASFAFGHLATQYASELPVTIISRLVAIVALIALITVMRINTIPKFSQLPILILMGSMDAIAHASVISAGQMEKAEYAAVAASTFGMVTILLAWLFLKETMTAIQWVGVVLVFSGIAYLASN
ncbi:MAG: DMT family transporter [Salaquimonas sp.]